MLGLIKSLPIIILLAGSGYAAHKFIVGQYEDRVTQLQQHVDRVNQQNVALQTAAQTNEATIRGLEEKSKQQVLQIGNLQTVSSQWEAQAKDAMRVFADHNFTKLARVKPGLIEDRANAATRDVFRSVEADSKETEQLDNTEQENNDVNETANNSK